MSVNYENIVNELKIENHWVNWKSDKTPINPHSGYGAKAGVKSTWSSFQIAKNVYENQTRPDIQGIGYEFSGNGKIGIDLDHCCEIMEDGKLKINNTALEIVRKLDTYAELSPSGHGIHIIGVGEFNHPNVGNGNSINGQAVEIYAHSRYFTMTGKKLSFAPATLNNITAPLNEIYQQLEQLEPKPISQPMDNQDHCEAIESVKIPMVDRVKQATRYLEACKGTKQGQGTAEKACLSICRSLLRGFALDESTTIDLIMDHWAGREDQLDEFGNHHPWRLDEITHKVKDCANFQYDGRVGDKLNGINPEILELVKAVEQKQIETNNTTNTKKAAYDFYSFSDLEKLPPPEWLIDNHFVAKSINEIWGESGSGKSFYALDMALSVAHGIDFLGQWKTKKTNVLYLASEGWDGIFKRGKAWGIAHNMPLPENIMICSNAINIPDDWEKFIKSAKAKYGQYPEFIVIDTLNLNFGAGDENSTKDMTRFIVAIREINELTKATIVVIHHSGKDVSKGSRGSYSLKCAVSTEIYVEGTGQAINSSCIDSLKVECKKQKDAPPFAPYHLKAKHYETGDMYGSLALEPLDKLQEEYQDLKCNVAMAEFIQAINATFGNGHFSRSMAKESYKKHSANTVDSYITALTNRGLLAKVGGKVGGRIGTGKAGGSKADLFVIVPRFREYLLNSQLAG